MTEQHPDFTLYSLDDPVDKCRKHIFYTDRSVWTLDGLHEMVTMLKHYIQEEDIKEFKRLGRYDLIGLERVESWEAMKSETE